MTEDEWLECREPQKMLDWLRTSGKLSDRRARLIAVACCRRVWHLLEEPAFRKAVERAERFADCEVTSRELEAAWRATFRQGEDDGLSEVPLANARFWAADAATQAACDLNRAFAVANSAAWATSWGSSSAADASFDQERAVQCDLVRCLSGSPFRPLPPLAPSLLTWHDGIVVKLAQVAYDARLLPSGELDQARVRVLADALEDAGCGDAGLLSHLRGPGPHVRGCAVIDALLGKS
jgi:hypothetical protein